MNLQEKQEQLQAMFEPDDIEWRVQRAGFVGEKAWLMAVPYITARAVQERFDEVFGPFGWEPVFRDIVSEGKVIGCQCGITVHTDSRSITKWDASENTNIEAIKGGRSTAMKRAAVQWGVGRYLYQMETTFAECRKTTGFRDKLYGNIHVVRHKGKPDEYIDWRTPFLPHWAIPREDLSPYLDAIRKAEDMDQLSCALEGAVKAINAAQDANAKKEFTKLKKEKYQELNSKASEINERKTEELMAKAKELESLLANIPTKGALFNAFEKGIGQLQKQAKKDGISAESATDALRSTYKVLKSKMDEGNDHDQ
jgi:Uncharacterized protein conserved in bacteria